MKLDLKKEGAVIRSLLDKAEGVELSAEVTLEKAKQDADEMRWQAAARCFDALTASGLTQKVFARETGVDPRQVSDMVRVWAEWQGGGTRPRYHDAVAVLMDRTVQDRAHKAGRSPQWQARHERTTAQMIRDEDTAKVIMQNPVVRESAKRAIMAAEADEAKQRLLANAQPVELPVTPSGFNWLEARGTLSQARIAITAVIRMAKEHGPLVREDVEALQEELADIKVAIEWLETVMATGDIDDELVRLLDEGV